VSTIVRRRPPHPPGARVPDHWSDRQRTATTPSARSLLFTILGEYVLPHDGVAWVGALVRGLELLDVEEKAARQAIARTSADGYIARERVGKRVRCHLTPAGRELLVQGAERIYGFGGAQDDWDGRFVLLVCDESKGGRDAKRRLRTRLAWAGFGQLQPGLWVGAHAEREGEAAAVLRNVPATSFVARSGEIGDARTIVERAWDIDALAQRYDDFIETFGPRRPGGGDETFVALTELVHAWRQFPFLDPALPRDLLPKRWSGDRAHDLFTSRRGAWSTRATAAFASY
jgi:phenylacetic acid degradation operon negative regulatory protein